MESLHLQSLAELSLQASREVPEDVIPLGSAPAPAVQRTYPGAPMPQEPSFEGDYSHAGGGVRDAFHSRPGSTPSSRLGDVRDGEVSFAAMPDEAVDVVPSVWEPYMNRFRLIAVCFANFNGALNDSAAGALIPYMEKHYDIGYAIVSLIFVGQSIGFILAAVALDGLRARLGRARIIGIASVLIGCGFIPIATAAPFPVVVCSFIAVGFGLNINIAIANLFCGSVQNSTFMLGLLHGCYGVGGTTGPLIATALVTVAKVMWARYYLITMGLAFLSLGLSVWSFWRYEQEQSPHAREMEKPVTGNSLQSMLAALKLRVVLLGCIFIFAYQGAEVSISGWVISFLINVRDGDPSSVGYVTSGFWAGITIGRFALSGVAQRVGEKLFVYGLIAGAAAFQILVWFVPNIVGNAVAVSIVGLLLGPIYPCCASVFMRSMTGRELLSGMGVISACGSLGGALAPFITGLLAQTVGTYVLHPIVIFLFLVMVVCWWGVPDGKQKRAE